MNILNDTVQKSFTVSNLPVSALFTVSDTSFCNMPATVSFLNQSINATSYQWNFGDGNTSTDISPVHVYQNIGQYNVSLTADAGACGNHTYVLPYAINVGLPPPTITHAENCGSASLTLSATGYSNIDWYVSPLFPIPFHSGTSYTTPLLDTTTTYYVQGSVINTPFNVGKPDNTGSGGYYNNSGNSHFLIFDCYTPVELLSVKIYANGGGNRLILLRDSTSNILDSATVFVPNGESRVNLNFNIPVGNKLQLVGNGAVNFYRNNNNSATYPYEVSGIISIIESSASLAQYNYTYGNYYYFYDWEVKEPDCYSQMQEVTAYILDEPECHFNHNLTGYTVQFSDQSLYAMNYMWYFGDGNVSTQANPTHTYAGPGTYTVKLVISNICGADSTESQVIVQGMAPVVDFIADNVNITEGDFVSFTDLSQFVPHTWNWIFEGGTPSQSSIQNPVVQYNTQGAYYVTLVAINDFGNGYANKPYYINVEPSSVNEKESSKIISVYPNPVIDKSFVLSGVTIVEKDDIHIYNVIGEPVPFIINEISSDRVKIGFHKLTSGVYFLNVSTNNSNKVVKFVVY